MATLLLKKSYQLSNLKEVTFKDLWGSRGVFTTMRMVGKPPKLILLKPHIENLIKSTKKYGIRKTLDGAEYLEHSLIGRDGRYTREGTLNLPADFLFFKVVIDDWGTIVGSVCNLDRFAYGPMTMSAKLPKVHTGVIQA